ncbi:MAG: DUF4097 family beta strand repeat-containing protein [Thermaerobacter sp.]|nr:DUF4097 family beta strand repeat-containing protein [Thermaerobacter sp.]
MPTFEAPEPISLDLKIGIANICLTASERADTTVEVLPTNPSSNGDVAAAAETRVDYGDGRLSVQNPLSWRQRGWWGWGKKGSVDVRIEMPSGSRVNCDAVMVTFESVGPLGECRVTVGAGEIHVEQAGPAQLKTGAGDVTADHILDWVEIKTGTGAVRVGSVDGAATIHNSNGATQVGEATGKVDVHAANGRITVDRARDSVLARTANGDVEIGQVEGGAITAHTACGRVEIGVRDGVAAWLDLTTNFGHVRNDLDTAEQPDGAQATVEVHVHTGYGDISVHRVATGGAQEVTA